MRHDDTVQELVELPWAVIRSDSRLQGLLGPLFLLAPVGSAGAGPPRRHAACGWRRSSSAPPGTSTSRRDFWFRALPLSRAAHGARPDALEVAGGGGTVAHVAFLAGCRAALCQPMGLAPDRDPGAGGAADRAGGHLPRRDSAIPVAPLIERTVLPPTPRSSLEPGGGSVHAAQCAGRVLPGGLEPGAGRFLRTALHQPCSRPTGCWTSASLLPVCVASVSCKTASSSYDKWSISELRVFRGETDCRGRPSGAPLGAEPWDVQLAFDDTPVTRWRSWRAISNGEFAGGFRADETIDRVLVECARDQFKIKLKLEGAGEDGVNGKSFPGAGRQFSRTDPQLRRMAWKNCGCAASITWWCIDTISAWKTFATMRPMGNRAGGSAGRRPAVQDRQTQMRLFLGVDGGQSSTTALIGDESGRVLGAGAGRSVQSRGARRKDAAAEARAHG